MKYFRIEVRKLYDAIIAKGLNITIHKWHPIIMTKQPHAEID